jgi:hypothetical protein
MTAIPHPKRDRARELARLRRTFLSMPAGAPNSPERDASVEVLRRFMNLLNDPGFDEAVHRLVERTKRRGRSVGQRDDPDAHE